MTTRGEDTGDTGKKRKPADDSTAPAGGVRRAVALPAMSEDPEHALIPAASPSAAADASGDEKSGESPPAPVTAAGRSTSEAAAADPKSRNEAKQESNSSSNGEATARTATADTQVVSDADGQEPGVAVALGSRSPGGEDEAGDGDSGKPKKPFLAAAAIAGVVLAAVPLLIFATGKSDDSEKKNTAAAVNVGTPVDEASNDAPPAQYVPDKPKNDRITPKPSPTESPLGQPHKSPDTTADAKPTDTVDNSRVVRKNQSSAGGASTPVTYRLASAETGKCLSADHASDGAALFIWDCDGSHEQKWSFSKDGTIRLKGLCMDVAGASKETGTAVQLARCSGNSAQKFRLRSTKELFAVDSGLCLDVWWGKRANGTPVKTWDCIAGQKNQDWSRT